MKKPIIIDCDPGLDDAIAIFMIINNPNFNIRAVTPVAGNQTVDKTSKNALDLTDYAGSDVPVAIGAARPLFKKLVTAEHVHGKTGLGDISLPHSHRAFSGLNAFEMIYQEAERHENELEIIALGPLTNIAITLLKYPDIKEKIKRITIMGGSCGCGNDTPAAEFNIYADSDAAKIVFDSGIPLTMVGLDATHKAMVYEEEINEISGYNNKVAQVAARILTNSLSFCRKHGFEGSVMHDPLAMACVMDPSVISTKKLRVDIETKGAFTNGKTVADIFNVTGKKANADVAMDINRERFIKILKKAMMDYGV